MNRQIASTAFALLLLTGCGRPDADPVTREAPPVAAPPVIAAPTPLGSKSYDADCSGIALVNADRDKLGRIVVTAAWDDDAKVIIPATATCTFQTATGLYKPVYNRVDWTITADADGFGGGTFWSEVSRHGHTTASAPSSDFGHVGGSGSFVSDGGYITIGMAFDGVTTLKTFNVHAVITPLR
mgnify:FL=1